MHVDETRRELLEYLGAVFVAGSFAGCSGDDAASEPSPTTTVTRTATGTGTATTAPTTPTATTAMDTPTGSPTGESTSTPTDEPTPTATPSVEGYLEGANGYGGTIADETGRDAVTVVVGAGDQGFRFAPAGIRITPETTVTWAWASGARHNVVAADGTFDSGEPVVSDEETFAHTFGGAGAWRYYCEPHRAVGMRGAVVVER